MKYNEGQPITLEHRHRKKGKIKMKDMTVMEIEKVLGERVRATLEKGLSPEEQQIENEKSTLIIGLAKQYLNGVDIALRIEKLQAQTGALKDSCAMKLLKGE